MIFNKTMQAVKDFDSIIKGANETFRVAKKTAMETYKEPAATAMVHEARKALTNVHIRETNSARDAVKADFANVRSKVNAVVTTVVPVDFAVTLAAIQARGKSVTDYEANAYVEKYKGNYPAFTTILDVLHQSGKAMDVIAYKPEAIDYQISEVERLVLNWIQNHASSNDDSYITTILTDDKHSLIVKLADEVQAFLDGRFALGAEEAAQLSAAMAANNN